MPRHGDLGQVVMNEYSALLLLSFFSVLMLFLFCCNYALDDCLDPQTPRRTRVWQDPGTRPHLILVFHSYKLMDAASKIRAYPFYSDTENHFFVPARTAQDPVDAFLVFLIYWSKSSISLNCRPMWAMWSCAFFAVIVFQSPMIQEACTRPVGVLMTTILRRRRLGESSKTCRYQYQ